MSAIGKKVWTFGSGKGGVGKSFLTAAMGTELARSGKSVAAVDANPASPNLHGFLGTKSPGLGLLDVLEGRATLDEISLLTSEPRLRLMSCAGDRLDGEEQIRKNLEHLLGLIQGLEEEYILVDLRPGASLDVMEFFNNSDAAVLVTTPHPASIQSAYRFLKEAVYRRIIHELGSHASVSAALPQLQHPERRSAPDALKEFIDLLALADPDLEAKASAVIRDCRPRLLVNMVTSRSEENAAETIESAARKYLNLNLQSCGSISLMDSANGSGKVSAFSPGSPLQAGIRRALHSLLEDSPPEIFFEAIPPVAAAPAMGFNDNLTFMEKELHIQTEDSGGGDRCITTQVFCNGRVIMSTRSDYPDSSSTEHPSSRIMELMRTQHFNVIRQIENKMAEFQAAGCRN